MKTLLNFRTQAFLLLILSVVWATSFFVTLSAAETSTYNPSSWFLVVVLPFALLLLGTAFMIRESRQRIQHRVLYYTSVVASFLPLFSIALRIYLHLHSAN